MGSAAEVEVEEVEEEGKVGIADVLCVVCCVLCVEVGRKLKEEVEAEGLNRKSRRGSVGHRWARPNVGKYQ